MQKDYKLGLLAGFLTGICLIPTLWNIGYKDSSILTGAIIASSIVIAFGVWLGNTLSRWVPVMFQLAKFAAVGFLNTAINFGLLNLFSIMAGVTSGLEVGGINVPGTLLAASNSYVWNKLWVFRKIDNKGFFKDAPKFIVVTMIALVVNSLIIVAFTSYLKPAFGLSAEVWLNIGKLLATIIGLLVDFLGYKFIVFKK